MGEGLDGDTGSLGTENGTIGGTFDEEALYNIVADNSNTFTRCLSYHNSAQTCRTPKPSTGRIAYDVRMRPVHWVWVLPAHRQC
jgi:hypothetical protein